MTTYAYDCFGAAIDVLDDEVPVVGRDWKGQEIREDEQVLAHKAWFKYLGKLRTKDNYLFEDDIYSYIKTLEKEDLLEILEKIEVSDIIDAADMEKVYL